MPEQNRELKNRVREIRSHGSVRGQGRNGLALLGEQPFKDYLNTVDDLLKTVYGITRDDTGLELITVCHKAGETPEECVQQIADKYELENIGHYLENLLYA